MRMMTLGRTDLTVSAVGLGGIQFSKISKRATARVIATAHDCGITLLETAHGYFDSEEKIGAALGRKRRDMIIATKDGARDGKTLMEHLEISLKRLRTDYVDLFQLHGVDSPEDLEKAQRSRGAVAALERARRQGKIRSTGVSSHSLERSLEIVDLDWCDSIQYPISLINTEIPRSGLLGKARRNNVGLIAMKPLGGGRITDARLALSYIYRFRSVVPIVGVETSEQVRQLARIAQRPSKLTETHWRRIRHIRNTLGRVFCRACRYCEPCPEGISIFRVLYFPIFVKQMGVKRQLAKGVPDWLLAAENCVECGACEKRCPFHLHIIEGLKQNLAFARTLVGKHAVRSL